jgi:hypothetical protein
MHFVTLPKNIGYDRVCGMFYSIPNPTLILFAAEKGPLFIHFDLFIKGF